MNQAGATPPDGPPHAEPPKLLREEEIARRVERVLYVLLFTMLVLTLFLIPEIAAVVRGYGVAPPPPPIGHSHLGPLLDDLWLHRSRILNPLNNSFLRFFLFSMVLGVVYDQIKRLAPPGQDANRDGQTR